MSLLIALTALAVVVVVLAFYLFRLAGIVEGARYEIRNLQRDCRRYQERIARLERWAVS